MFTSETYCRGDPDYDQYSISVGSSVGTSSGITIAGSEVASTNVETCSFAPNTEYTFRSLTIEIPGVEFGDGAVVQTREYFNITAAATTSFINGAVHLLSNGTMEIRGVLDGNGRGYLSHQSPTELILDRPRSSGGGHGGSHGGVGDGLAAKNGYISTYGSIQNPTTKGSGGGRGVKDKGGGAGGAALRVTSAGKLIIGRRWVPGDKGKNYISMNGHPGRPGSERTQGSTYRWSPGGGGGAGGSIFLEADSIEITGRITANGGQGAATNPRTSSSWSIESGCDSNPNNRIHANGHGGCGGGGRIAIHCKKLWDGNLPQSKNWNALDVVSNAQPDVRGYAGNHVRPGGPGTLYYNCGKRLQELIIPYSVSSNASSHPWGPTVVAADTADGELHVDTLNIRNGARVLLGPASLVHHHNDTHQDLVVRDDMMSIHVGRILTTGRELSHVTGEAAQIIVSAGTKVVLRQTKDGARPVPCEFRRGPHREVEHACQRRGRGRGRSLQRAQCRGHREMSQIYVADGEEHVQRVGGPVFVEIRNRCRRRVRPRPPSCMVVDASVSRNCKIHYARYTPHGLRRLRWWDGGSPLRR